MGRSERALAAADLFVSIGTSGAVYPAAGFVQTARYAEARTVELNLEPSAGSGFFHETRAGPASDMEIGRESCRERVGQLVSLSVVAVSLKQKNTETYNIDRIIQRNVPT